MNFLLPIASLLIAVAGVIDALQQAPAPARTPARKPVQGPQLQRLPARPVPLAQQRARPAAPPVFRQPLKKTAAARPVQHAAPVKSSPVQPLPLTKQQQPPNAGMIRQCRCADIKPCKQRYIDSVEPCLDSCRHHIIGMGGNYEQVKKCFTPKESILKVTIQCTETQHGNACSKQSNVQFVPKRYKQTLENAVMAEIDRMIGGMGLDKSPAAKKLVSTSKKLFGCVKQCMGKRENCEKNLSCGLQLPPDNVLVQNTKRCAINSGFNTQNIRQICQCAANAGVKDLKSVCQKIVISS